MGKGLLKEDNLPSFEVFAWVDHTPGKKEPQRDSNCTTHLSGIELLTIAKPCGTTGALDPQYRGGVRAGRKGTHVNAVHVAVGLYWEDMLGHLNWFLCVPR